ncbi:MAG: YSIRK-type signal peptide-containing protein [Streptococcus salivarius]
MGKDLFNEKKSRFSLRKLNIGVCSVLLGTLIMIGGTAQADENTETTAAPVSPVVEAGETTASLVETRTVAETTLQRQLLQRQLPQRQLPQRQLLLQKQL